MVNALPSFTLLTSRGRTRLLIGLLTPLSNTSAASSFPGQDSSLYVISLSTFT